MYDAAANSEIEEVVSAYRPVQTVTAPQAKAVLYQRITVP
jgi:hypothetical protein